MKKLKVCLLTILFLCIGFTVSKAGYSASNQTVNSGENITITVSSDTALDAYNLDLKSYTGLTFVSCSKSETGAIIDINGSSIGYINSSGSTKTLGTYKFKAPTVTETKKYTVTFMVDQATTVTSTITVNPIKNETTNNSGNTTGNTTSNTTGSTTNTIGNTAGNTTNTNTSTGNTNTNTTTNSSTSTTRERARKRNCIYLLYKWNKG